MSGKHWVTEPNGYLEPVIDKSGEGARKAKTVIQVFQEIVAKHGNRSAMALKRKPLVCTWRTMLARVAARQHILYWSSWVHDWMDWFRFTFVQGGKVPKDWQIWTWSDYWNDSRKFAKALISLGVDKFGVVNIMGFNSVNLFMFFCSGRNLLEQSFCLMSSVDTIMATEHTARSLHLNWHMLP